MVEQQTRSDSKSGAERRTGATPVTPTCSCGSDIKFKKSAECGPCYHRRYYHTVRKSRIFEYLGGLCVVCGARDNLEVDHIDPSQKSFEINHNLTFDARLTGELDKCQLLCETHHLEKTVRDKPPFRHGTIYGFMKIRCSCTECSDRKNTWNAARNTARRSQNVGGRGTYGRSAEHGDILMYRRGCKCPECKAANTAYARTLRGRTA